MLFTLEALEAKKGDSLLLHFGTTAKPGLMVIDGGPSGVYKKTLKPRLEQLRASRAPDGKLKIDLAMVSHIDDDHVNGILAMLNELDDLRADHKTQPYNILTLWHNSFDDLLGNDTGVLTANLQPAAIAASQDLPIPQGVGLPAALILASVAQGRELRARAKALAIAANEGFKDLVGVPKGQQSKTVKFDGGLSFTVIGPSKPRVDDLRKEWDKQIKKMGVAKQAAFVDESVFNLSSIIVVAEAGKKRMLLTGDARGDDILAGLKSAKLMKKGKCHFDLFKIPHHGSDRNVTTEFFEQVTADDYVISGNGQHGNPEAEMLRMLSEARQGDDDFTLHLTNSEPRLAKFFASEKKKGRTYRVVFRDPAKLSLRVELGDALKD